jgi:hypothetical protein
MRLHAITYVTIFIFLLWIPNLLITKIASIEIQMLTLFTSINIVICVWEWSLFFNQAIVQREHKRLRKLQKKQGIDLPRPFCLFEKITVKQAISLKHWSIIWATYALLDPSYVEEQSFGFWVDTGNGITTVIPTIVLHIGSVRDLGVSPLVYGLIGFVFNYQMMYGTVLYFSNYTYHRYWEKASTMSRIVVFVSNMIWIVFPLWWMFVCFGIVRDQSFENSVLRPNVVS